MPFITNEQLEFLRYNCEWEYFDTSMSGVSFVSTTEKIDELGLVSIYADGSVYIGGNPWMVENTDYVKMTYCEIMKRTRSSSRYHVSPEEEALRKFIERSKF